MLRRDFISNRDEVSGAKYLHASMRVSDIIGRVLSLAGEEYGSEATSELIYIGWRIDAPAYPGYGIGNVRLVVLTKDYGLEVEDPPTPQLVEHMSSSQKWNYENAWNDYHNQVRGTLHIDAHDFAYNLNSDTWEYDTGYELGSLSPETATMQTIKNMHCHEGGSSQIEDPDDIVILNRLNEDVTFADELEPLDDEPTLETGGCEDYPCCGHDICPARWSTGQQADMRCVCGASVPLNSRFSICNSCMNAPDPDDPYGGGYDDDPGPDYCSEHECYAEDCPVCEECGGDDWCYGRDCGCERE